METVVSSGAPATCKRSWCCCGCNPASKAADSLKCRNRLISKRNSAKVRMRVSGPATRDLEFIFISFHDILNLRNLCRSSIEDQSQQAFDHGAVRERRTTQIGNLDSWDPVKDGCRCDFGQDRKSTRLNS